MSRTKYFISRKHEVIHALLYLDMEPRSVALNITPTLYAFPQLADRWRDELHQLIISDDRHPDEEKALDCLERLFSHMIYTFEDDRDASLDVNY